MNTSVGRLRADSLRFRARARPAGIGLLGRRELFSRGGIARGEISLGCTDAAAGEAAGSTKLFPLLCMLARLLLTAVLLLPLLLLLLLPVLKEADDSAEEEEEEEEDLRAAVLKRCWVVALLVAAMVLDDMRCFVVDGWSIILL